MCYDLPGRKASEGIERNNSPPNIPLFELGFPCFKQRKTAETYHGLGVPLPRKDVLKLYEEPNLWPCFNIIPVSYHQINSQPSQPSLNHHVSEISVSFTSSPVLNSCWVVFKSPVAYWLNILVVWNMNFSFPYIGNSHPKWRSYFFRRVGIPPTRYYWGWSLSLDGKSLSPPTFGFFMTRHESEFRSHNAQFTITGLYVLQPHLNERYAYIYIYVIYIYSQPVAVIPIYNYQATTATSWRKIWLQLGFSVSQSLAIGPLP